MCIKHHICRKERLLLSQRTVNSLVLKLHLLFFLKSLTLHILELERVSTGPKKPAA